MNNQSSPSTTYQEVLKHAPKEHCQRVAKRIGLSDRIPVSKLRQQIPQKLLDLDFLRDLVSRLTPYERLVLTMLTFSGGTSGVPFELFNRKLNQMSKKWPQSSRGVRQSLNEFGLVFAMTVGNFRYSYVIPEELRRVLLKILAKEMLDKLKSPTEALKTVRNDGSALIQDIFTFLAFAAKHEIRVTQQRTIYKRTEQRILKSFEVAEDTSKIYDRINPTEGNTDRLEFIYEFCWRRRLLEWEDSNLTCSAIGRTWLQKSDAEKLVDVYGYWLDSFVSTRPPLAIALSVLQILPPERWILLSSIQKQVRRFSVDVVWTQTLFSDLERAFINYLTYMGCVAFSPLKDDVALQITDLGRRLLANEPIETYEPETTFILQPNHEILASSYLDADIRWTLNRFADIHQAGQMTTYRLTAPSIYDGLRSGMSIDALLEFLRTYSKTGIPQNVELSVQEWAERYGQVYFMDVMLLRCKSERIAHELKASKQFGKYILGEISPTDLIVSRERVDELRGLLEKRDYMPLPEVVLVE